MKRETSVLCYLLSGTGMLLVFLGVAFRGNAQEPAESVKDIDGNVYKTVKIGTQVWMRENLKTTKYSDGTAIPNVIDDTQWAKLTTGALCWHGNDAATHKDPYGALYNWYAVETGKLCPTGWHVSSDKEWTVLMDYLGGYAMTGAKLKEAGTTHWSSPNAGATNESGFTALPGGSRDPDSGMFYTLMKAGWWWTSTHDRGPSLIQLRAGDQGGPWMRVIFWEQTSIKRNNAFLERTGFSVRCVKD